MHKRIGYFKRAFSPRGTVLARLVSCQACESSAWNRGRFIGPRPYVAERFGVPESMAETRYRLRGLNDRGGVIGLGSGDLESIEQPRRDRGGAWAGKPSGVRILAMTGGCSMAAMIFKVPPYRGDCSMSISNTRLRKPSLAYALRAGIRRSKPLLAVLCGAGPSSCAQAPRERARWHGPRGSIGVDRRARKARHRNVAFP